MRLDSLEELSLYVTSDELRALADKMEKQWGSSDYGDCLVTEIVDNNKQRLRIKFVIDQDEMRRRSLGKGGE